jgi:hypothetical protein
MSLYEFDYAHGQRANHVSFDRPYAWKLQGGQSPLVWEIQTVRFLERMGYDVSYQTDVDTHRDPGSLLRHRLVLVNGHDEYWTKQMFDAFDAARNRGTNLAFMGANAAYWQIRYEDAERTVVAYKSFSDPIADPALKTVRFRELTPPRYECALIGIQHQGAVLDWPPGDYVAQGPALDDAWMAGTGFKTGDVVRGVVSTESDTIPGNETAASSCTHSLTVFFHRERGGDKDGNADAIRYTDRSGARVFASGSHQWSWALDSFRYGSQGGDVPADPRIQRFMTNALDDHPAGPTDRGHGSVRRSGVVLAAARTEDPRARCPVPRRPGAGRLWGFFVAPTVRPATARTRTRRSRSIPGEPRSRGGQRRCTCRTRRPRCASPVPGSCGAAASTHWRSSDRTETRIIGVGVDGNSQVRHRRPPPPPAPVRLEASADAAEPRCGPGSPCSCASCRLGSMARYRYVVADVFTDTPLTGNQLAVSRTRAPARGATARARPAMNPQRDGLRHPSGGRARAHSHLHAAVEVPFAATHTRLRCARRPSSSTRSRSRRGTVSSPSG